MIDSKDIIKSKITLDINLNDDSEFIGKLNKISTELNLELDNIIKLSILKLYNDIEYIRNLRKKGND